MNIFPGFYGFCPFYCAAIPCPPPADGNAPDNGKGNVHISSIYFSPEGWYNEKP